MNISDIRERYLEKKVLWQVHCLSRMHEREISISDIDRTILSGKIIEEYNDDYPHPSCLIMGNSSGRVIHCVVGMDEERLYMITAYEPCETVFEKDMITRKEK